jgi:hypothetical protein
MVSAQDIIYPLRTQVFLEKTNRYFNSKSYYEKDIAGDLPPFVGTWKGTFQDDKKNTLTFYLTLNEIIKYKEPSNYDIYSDILVGQWKVVSANGTVESDTYAYTGGNSPILGQDFVGDNYYLMYVNDPERPCLTNIRIWLELKYSQTLSLNNPQLTPPTLIYHYKPDWELWLTEECAKVTPADMTPRVPMVSITLTKVQ